MSFAKVTLLGNLGRDGESAYTPNGKHKMSFSMAVSRKRGDAEITNWYAVTCWGQLAETMERLGALTKGSRVLVTGRLEPREYEHNGQQRTALEVTADDVMLLDKREQGGEGGGNVPF